MTNSLFLGCFNPIDLLVVKYAVKLQVLKEFDFVTKDEVLISTLLSVILVSKLNNSYSWDALIL